MAGDLPVRGSRGVAGTLTRLPRTTHTRWLGEHPWQRNMARRAHFLHKIEQLTLFVRFGERYSAPRNFNFNCNKQGECK